MPERRILPMSKASPAIIILAVLATAAAAYPPAAGETFKSAWTASPPKIDGKADEWAGAALSVWEKGDVHYAFRNDADKLYILLVFKNRKYLSTIGETGVTIFFSPAGKKDKDYAIHFVRRQVPTEEAIALIEREKPLSEEEKAQLRSKPAYAIYDHQVRNKKAKSKEAPAGSEFQPAHFRFSPAQTSMVYEFAVMLRRGHGLAAGVGAAPGEVVAVGFEWGGATDAQLKRAVRNADAGIVNENSVSSSIDKMSTRGVSLPPKYSFWTSVELASPGR
jgi:hypothetical protein